MKKYLLIGIIYYGEGVDEPWTEFFWETIEASGRIDALGKSNISITKRIVEAQKNPSFKSLEAHVHTPSIGTIRRLRGDS